MMVTVGVSTWAISSLPVSILAATKIGVAMTVSPKVVESRIRCFTKTCSRDSLWVMLSLRIRSILNSDMRVVGATPVSLLLGCQPG